MTTPTCPTCHQPGTPCLAIVNHHAVRAYRCDHCRTLLEPCTCTPDGCDEDGDPGCHHCQQLDPEHGCPIADHDEPTTTTEPTP